MVTKTIHGSLGCGGRVVDVEEVWMWSEDGFGGRVVDMEEVWMWREGGGCGGRMVDVEGGLWNVDV